MANEIVFYVTDRGEFPVLEFLLALSDKERAKCVQYIDALAEHGNALPANYVKHLEQGVWELRPEFGGTEFRLFYFTVIENSFVMLHAIKKKTRSIPRREIELAIKRMKEVKQ